MYYVDSEGKRVYTLEVRTALILERLAIPLHAHSTIILASAWIQAWDGLFLIRCVYVERSSW